LAHLTQGRADALKSYRKSFGVHDTDISRFGAQIYPSGGERCFLCSQIKAHRV